MTDAGTLEVTETISHLDEEEECAAPYCFEEPKWLVFGTCLCTSMVCNHHARAQRDYLALVPSDFRAKCQICGQLCLISDVKILPL